ncbi:peptidase C14 [Arthroderma uncinatum]|uniref:peptidase C14 n=1 Tax=Arthroderma uncinatum TaxID=74035 RepID=UPI00144A713B|nr:peptidase C14 [Arthroderma uncinatum]KAF3481565.1 peptidase C14 [Arthroderma uncinatum]
MAFFWRKQRERKISNEPYHGLKVLVPRPESSGPEPVVDVVFVHGLNGDCIKTWKHADAEVPWIMDKRFLGDLYDRARIMTFGYNANVLENVTTSRVLDHANDLLEAIYARRVRCEGRPIVFVAHSLGGLVVKQAMILCHDDDRYADINTAAGGLIFMGTPHEGSSQASLLGTIQNIASFATMGQNKTALTQELQTYSATTMSINKSFMRNASRSREIVCFHETLPTRLPQGERMIVEPGSAVINGNNARNIGMACNHQELCKFKSSEEGRFESIFWPQFEMVVENATQYQSKILTKKLRELLPYADQAQYDSRDHENEDLCLLGTRTELCSQVSEWAESPGSKNIFWLNGIAGTGKSTIARTVATSFKDKGQLGATFFFKRGRADCGNAKYLISTITRQVVAKHQRLARDVLNAIDDDPDILSKFLSVQFDKLLLQPLRKLDSSIRPTTIVIKESIIAR